MIQRNYELMFGFELWPAITLAARHGLRVVETTPMFLTAEGDAANVEIFGDHLEQLLRLSR